MTCSLVARFKLTSILIYHFENLKTNPFMVSIYVNILEKQYNDSMSLVTCVHMCMWLASFP